ncbi:MAG: hypothetical protein PHY43_05760 [Verrucomicrobiales bacterium]|nr:hypothetical protein [Verrucomicrobiales bacterium]
MIFLVELQQTRSGAGSALGENVEAGNANAEKSPAPLLGRDLELLKELPPTMFFLS